MTEIQTIMQLVSGVWAAKTLAAALEIGLFDTLSAHPGAALSDLAASLDLEPRPTRSLVTACAALGLITRTDDRCFNNPLTERYLVRDNPGYFGGWVELLDRHDYHGWMRLTTALRTNRPTAWDPDTQTSLFDGADPTMMETFWQAMYAVSTISARQFNAAPHQATDLADTTALLDVGGGGAAWDIELCRHHRWLRAAVYDLPHVCKLTAEKIQQAGLTDRIATIPGDFLADPALPRGFDALLLSSILHDWDDGTVRTILSKCFTALDPGGRIIIAELFLNDTEDGPLDAALMGLAMQVETWGRSYTTAELTAWLTDIGFTDPAFVAYAAPTANGALIARKL